MKAFISWSGPLAMKVAELLRDFLRDVLKDVEPWISTDDIDKGSIWFGDITEQFKETGIGIICVTRENVAAPWLLFEAGAICKGLSKNRVCPLLIELSPADLRPPLSQFNATEVRKDDVLKLFKTINGQVGEGRLPDDRLIKHFDKWWDEFYAKFQSIVGSHNLDAPTKPKRTTDEMVTEVLELTRSIQKTIQARGPGMGRDKLSALLAEVLVDPKQPDSYEYGTIFRSNQPAAKLPTSPVAGYYGPPSNEAKTTDDGRYENSI